MANESDSIDRRKQAVELNAQAVELQSQRKYYEAAKYYEKSLELNEDEEVRTAYLRLLAIIGPE